MLLSGGQHAMDMLPSITYVVWMHEQRLNAWDIIIHMGAVHLTLGHRFVGFGEKCRITMPSVGWCMLFHEEP
jgi:hypothetical protein